MAIWPIDPDVRRIAKRFGVDPALIAAVEKAEGNLLKAVQCSVNGVTTREQALEITCRSAAHAMSDFIKSHRDASEQPLRDAFVDFWAARWAPVGADNDPTALNHNWPVNVLKSWDSL